jgi:hypothetical protein
MKEQREEKIQEDRNDFNICTNTPKVYNLHANRLSKLCRKEISDAGAEKYSENPGKGI